MAEFLVMARNNSSPDPVLDAAMYKRGDIVAVYPDGNIYGALEDPAIVPRPQWKFVIVKIPGLNPENPRVLQALMSDQMDGEGRLTLRKAWGLTIDDIPAVIRNQLLNTGIVTVTLAQIRNFIKNKLTGETF